MGKGVQKKCRLAPKKGGCAAFAPPPPVMNLDRDKGVCVMFRPFRKKYCTRITLSKKKELSYSSNFSYIRRVL